MNSFLVIKLFVQKILYTLKMVLQKYKIDVLDLMFIILGPFSQIINILID